MTCGQFLDEKRVRAIADGYPQFISRLSTQHLYECIEVPGDVGRRGTQLGDLAARMKDCRVITTTKRITDVRQAERRQFLCECHGNLAKTNDHPQTFLRIHLRYLDLVVISHYLLDVLD